ncbi:hypothetical protein [Nonomuraea helvata]|uniref:Uncharacterized protein n=1 Tax=Nonomuraea helvata TaxID=37484 RepID=A0ABV5S735_9ACTN
MRPVIFSVATALTAAISSSGSAWYGEAPPSRFPIASVTRPARPG